MLTSYHQPFSCFRKVSSVPKRKEKESCRHNFNSFSDTSFYVLIFAFFFFFTLFGLLYERISFQVLITENSGGHQILTGDWKVIPSENLMSNPTPSMIKPILQKTGPFLECSWPKKLKISLSSRGTFPQQFIERKAMFIPVRFQPSI